MGACAACSPSPAPPGELQAAFVPARLTASPGDPLRAELRIQNIGLGPAMLASPLAVHDVLRAETMDGKPLKPVSQPAGDAAGGQPWKLPDRWEPGARSEFVLFLQVWFPDIANPGAYRIVWSHPSFSATPPLEVEIVAQSTATLQTNFGDIVLRFHPEDAPKTVENFIKLAKSGYYDGLPFHRIIPGFMMQGGCPKGDGTGGPGYTIKAEFNKRKHVAGTVSMARTSDPDSAGSQFFICFATAAHLDGQYTAFAEVTQGLDVVKKIEPVGSSSGRPSQKVVMNKVIIHENSAPGNK
jgi:cyclophilin family peptidyl-prolyl cis-trans isomerase